MPALTAEDVLLGLQIAIAILVIVALYHVLFIVVDLRKVLRRIDDITEQVETIILKPISMADQILSWVMDMVEQSGHKKEKKHKAIKK